MAKNKELNKDKEQIEDNKHDDGTYTVKRNRTESVIAFVVCLLIAMAIWVYAKNSEQMNNDGPSDDIPAAQSQQADAQA